MVRLVTHEVSYSAFDCRKEKKSKQLKQRGSKSSAGGHLNKLKGVRNETFQLSSFLKYMETSNGQVPENLVTANMYSQVTGCKYSH